MYPQSMFWSKNKKNVNFFFLLKIFIFYYFKNFCILHGRVFVMLYLVGVKNVVLFKLILYTFIAFKSQYYHMWKFIE